MMTTEHSHVHRLLDEAFAGIDMTPETQDLKEELRSSLVARVAELADAGVPDPEASRRAMDELGDVREAAEGTLGEPSAGGAKRAQDTTALWQANRVRPRPAFVLRAVALSLVIVAGLTLVALAVFDVLTILPGAVTAIALGTVALPVGLLVADSLRQETTTNYPMPRARAALYGTSVGAIVLGLAFAGWFVADTEAVGALVGGICIVVLASLELTYLGVTQTNRKKAWVRGMEPSFESIDAFTNNPAAAARFGIYSGVLWITALAAFVALSLTVGFAWSWVALVVALIVQMLMTARMLFRDGAPRS